MRTASGPARAGADEVPARAARLVRQVAPVLLRSHGLEVGPLLAVGGHSAVFLGTWSNQKVVLKIPLASVDPLPGRVAGKTNEALEQVRQEVWWLDLLSAAGVFPERLLPKGGGDPELLLDSGRAVPYLVVRFLPGLTLRELVRTIRANRRLGRIAGGSAGGMVPCAPLGGVLASVLLSTIEKLRLVLNAGGIYADLSLDDVVLMTSEAGVRLLDAGGIVALGSPGPVVFRQELVPTAIAAPATAAGADTAALERLLLGVLAKSVACELLGVRPEAGRDPSSGLAGEAAGLAALGKFFRRAMLGAHGCFSGFDEALGVLRPLAGWVPGQWVPRRIGPGSSGSGGPRRVR